MHAPTAVTPASHVKQTARLVQRILTSYASPATPILPTTLALRVHMRSLNQTLPINVWPQALRPVWTWSILTDAATPGAQTQFLASAMRALALRPVHSRQSIPIQDCQCLEHAALTQIVPVWQRASLVPQAASAYAFRVTPLPRPMSAQVVPMPLIKATAIMIVFRPQVSSVISPMQWMTAA